MRKRGGAKGELKGEGAKASAKGSDTAQSSKLDHTKMPGINYENCDESCRNRLKSYCAQVLLHTQVMRIKARDKTDIM